MLQVGISSFITVLSNLIICSRYGQCRTVETPDNMLSLTQPKHYCHHLHHWWPLSLPGTRTADHSIESGLTAGPRVHSDYNVMIGMPILTLGIPHQHHYTNIIELLMSISTDFINILIPIYQDQVTKRAEYEQSSVLRVSRLVHVRSGHNFSLSASCSYMWWDQVTVNLNQMIDDSSDDLYHKILRTIYIKKYLVS